MCYPWSLPDYLLTGRMSYQCDSPGPMSSQCWRGQGLPGCWVDPGSGRNAKSKAEHDTWHMQRRGWGLINTGMWPLFWRICEQIDVLLTKVREAFFCILQVAFVDLRSFISCFLFYSTLECLLPLESNFHNFPTFPPSTYITISTKVVGCWS